MAIVDWSKDNPEAREAYRGLALESDTLARGHFTQDAFAAETS